MNTSVKCECNTFCTKPKVSVVIPVYKVEKYLQRCLDSVINQTLKDIEIILIDDGSPDNCGRICDQYSEKDSRIKVIHKKNEGVSAARNDGIKAATGEYIGFVDSDDYIAENMFEVMYQQAYNYNADISMCEFVFTAEGTEPIFSSLSSDDYKGIQLLSKEDIFSLVVDFSKMVQTNIWNKLFRTDIVKKIKFDVNKKMSEDLEFLMETICECHSAVYVPYVFYAYIFIREGSAMYSVGKSIDWYKLQDIYITNIMQKVVDRNPDLKNMAISYRCVNGELSMANAIVRQNSNDKDAIKYVRNRLKKDLFVVLASNLQIIKKMQVAIFVFSPKIYAVCMKNKMSN